MSKTEISFKQLFGAIGTRLQARVDLGAVYAHPSGTGDEREHAVLQALRESLPSRFGLTRGRIVDSTGALSSEFDIIIYEAADQFIGFECGHRAFVPVESVYAVIEVKSKLDKQKLTQSFASLRTVEKLRRHYRWIDTWGTLYPEAAKTLETGVLAGTHFMSLGIIWSAIVSFSSMTPNAIAKHFRAAPDSLTLLCVPGDELVIRRPGTAKILGVKLDEATLGLFAWSVLDSLTGNARTRVFAPDFTKYRDRLIKELGAREKWVREV